MTDEEMKMDIEVFKRKRKAERVVNAIKWIMEVCDDPEEQIDEIKTVMGREYGT